MSNLPPITPFFSQYILLAPKSLGNQSRNCGLPSLVVLTLSASAVRGHIVFSNCGNVLDRMCYSIFVPDGCCGNSYFNPRESFKQLLISAVVQVDFLGC